MICPEEPFFKWLSWRYYQKSMLFFPGQILKFVFFACVLQSLPFQDIQNGSISNIYSSQDVQNGSISNMLIIMTPQNDWQHIFIIILTNYSDWRHIFVLFHYYFNPNSLRSTYIQIQSWSWVLETVINTLGLHMYITDVMSIWLQLNGAQKESCNT